MNDLRLIKVEPGLPEEQTDMERANWVLAALCRHYPDHPWTVSVQGQGLIIRHMMISAVAAEALRRDGFSFLMPRDKMGTPREVAESAMRAGGQMLELFGLKRGQADGTMPTVPKDWKVKQTRHFA
jgi:hypothetical protein